MHELSTALSLVELAEEEAGRQHPGRAPGNGGGPSVGPTGEGMDQFIGLLERQLAETRAAPVAESAP